MTYHWYDDFNKEKVVENGTAMVYPYFSYKYEF